ncbi:MAG: hypothetical protein H0X30_01390 [Anaerolineae bacterium]|nr:hypothetical protein [Anaerolineae bacterium]
MLPNYQITVYSPLDGSAKAVFDGASFDDVKYSKILNDVGLFAATMPYSDQLASIFTLDSLIEVQRTSPLTGRLQTEDVYFCRLTHHFREGNEEKFVVGGLSLNHLLARRLVDPADDPLAAAGYSTKAGPADDILHDYANEQCGVSASAARQFPNFSVAPSSSVGASAGRRLRYENLLDIFQNVANQSNVDFTTSRITGNTLRLVIAPIGTDKTRSRNYPFAPFVELNPLRGNLSDPSLLFDRKQEQNYVYALAQGPGESRIVTRLSSDSISDSPYNRIEFTTDIRSAERGDNTTILTSARAALYDKQPHKEFTFRPSGTEAGGTYRIDYDIGDLVTCTFGNDSFDLRIRGVEITLSPNNEEISVTVAQR